MKKLLFLLVLIFGLIGCSYQEYIPVVLKGEVGNNVSIATKPITSEDSIDVYFSKQNQHPEIYLNSLIDSSAKTLDIATYGLTYPSTVQAIVNAKKRGVIVRVVSDKQQSGGETQKHAINILLLNNILVKIDSHSGLMHLKMTIVDEQVATTGSYNYTTNATDNNDEMLVIIDNADFVRKCLIEFNRMWNDDTHYTYANYHIKGER